MKLIVNAISIFKGGGKHVLEELLTGISQKKITKVIVLHDDRYKFKNNFVENKIFNGNFIFKFFKLLSFIREIEKQEKVLIVSLNSFPLPFCKSKQWVLFQNRNLLIKCIPEFELMYFLKASFFHILLKTCNYKNLRLIYHLDETLIYLKKINQKCKFIKASLIRHEVIKKLNKRKRNVTNIEKEYKFITITSDTLNKKNLFLLNSWKKVNQILPNLSLKIIGLNNKEKSFQNMNVEFYKYLNWNQTQKLMSKSDFLIFCSISECLGLPLVEAESNNLKVIAPDLNFVWEASIPYKTFNPNSEDSLIRTILKSVGVKYDNSPNFISGKEFLKLIEDIECIVLT